MPEIPYCDWITAVFTVSYLQLLAWKKWYGWPLGVFTQLIWFYLTLSKGLYGLTVLSVVMAIQFGYGWFRWVQDENPSKGQSVEFQD